MYSIGFISDLHIDYNEHKLGLDLTKETIDFFEQKDLDFLIISGDISSSFEFSSQFVNELNRAIRTKVFYVPGNHDVWSNKNIKTETILKKFENDPNCLLYKIVELPNNNFLIGGFPWYDYSLDTQNNPEQKIIINQKIWADNLYTNIDNWKEFSLNEQKKLENIISESPKNGILTICQHFVPSEKFLVEKPNDPSWNDMNAFMGSKNISKLKNKFNNIKNITFGHTHKRFGNVKFNGVNYISGQLGYKHEWTGDSYLKELNKVLITKNF